MLWSASCCQLSVSSLTLLSIRVSERSLLNMYSSIDVIRGTSILKKLITAIDAEVQDIRANKQREARFMKEQVERRRELRKNRDKIMLNMVKALEDQGMTEAQVVQTIATMQAILQTEAQKYYDQLVVAS